MDFHVPHPQLSVHLHFRVEEIRPRVAVEQSRVDDVHRFSAVRLQSLCRQQSVLPNVMQQFFHVQVGK